MAVMLDLSLVVIIVLFATTGFAARECSRHPPGHVKVECQIVPDGSQCYRRIVGDRLVNHCPSRAACLVWSGVDLTVSCQDDGAPATEELILQRNATWTFADPETARGLYECRFSNGTSFANRTVRFNEHAHVIPGHSTNYGQSCQPDIVPQYMENYDCNVAQSRVRFHGEGPYSLDFNVFGTRPIDIEIEALWLDHCPVNLYLSYPPEANNITLLHNVTLDPRDLVFAESRIVHLYVAVTVRGPTLTSTMCIRVELDGVTRLFPNTNLPRDVLVMEGEMALFECEAGTSYEEIDPDNVTLSLLIQPSASLGYLECLNCTISATNISACQENKENCFNLEFTTGSRVSSVVPGMERLIHRVTGQWGGVDVEFNQYRIACALAVNGVTQWLNSATITIAPTVTSLPPSRPSTPTPASTQHPELPTPTLETNLSINNNNVETEEEQGSLSDSAIAGISVVGVVLVLLLVAMTLAVVGLILRYRSLKLRGLDWYLFNKF